MCSVIMASVTYRVPAPVSPRAVADWRPDLEDSAASCALSLVAALDTAGFSAEQDGRLGRYDVYRADGTPGLVQVIFFAPDPEHQVRFQTSDVDILHGRLGDMSGCAL